MKPGGIVLGIIAVSVLLGNQGREAIESGDNIKLLWVEMQSVTYESAMHTSCLISGTQPVDPLKDACKANSLKNDFWQKRRADLYAEMERKYSTIGFTFNPENGVMSPHIGAAVAH